MSGRVGTKKRRIMVDALLKRDGGYCTWCCRLMIDQPIQPWQDCSLYMTVEHLIPLSFGGTNMSRNLALACFECNQARGASLGAFTPSWAIMSG